MYNIWHAVREFVTVVISYHHYRSYFVEPTNYVTLKSSPSLWFASHTFTIHIAIIRYKKRIRNFKGSLK